MQILLGDTQGAMMESPSCTNCHAPISSLDGGSSNVRVQAGRVFLGPTIEKQISFNSMSRQRFIEEGRMLERERILKILTKNHRCQHDPSCNGDVNINDNMRNDFGIDLEKLIKGE